MPDIIRYLLFFLLYLLGQKLVFDNIGLWGMAEAKPYILLLLFMPFSIGYMAQFGTAFVLGLLIDIFANTLGVNAFCAVLVLAIRPFWISLVSPQLAARLDEDLDVRGQDLGWQLTYVMPLLGIYLLTYYLLADFSPGWYTLGKTVLSTLYTGLFVFAILVFFYKQRDRR